MSEAPTLRQAIPILRIFSVEKAKEFYLGFLGFTWDWEHRFGDNFPLYAQVSRSGIVLHLSEHHGDACPARRHVMREASTLSSRARRLPLHKPGIEDEPWGARVIKDDPSATTAFTNRPEE